MTMPEARRARSTEGDTEAKDEAPAEANDKGRNEAPFYCPGCGKRGNYPQQCTGPSAAAPHPSIEMVSTDELSGDPEKLTPAPSTENLG